MINKNGTSLEEIILNHYNIRYHYNGIREFENTCFICGLPMEEITKEDYIPRWLMKEFELFQQKISLPNKTKYYFKNCNTPCCKKCNNETLSKIEINVKEILQKDIRAINENDEDVLFMWFMKIFMGFWFQSTKIKSNIKDKNSENLLSTDSLEDARGISALLKTIKYPVKFNNFRPYSIFKFKYKNTFDVPLVFHNDLRFPTLLFAYKKLAFVIAFNDDGIIKENFGNLGKTEFSEVEYPELLLKFCEVVTAQELTQKIYHYLVLHNEVININRVIMPENKGKKPILPWNVSILQRNINEHFDKEIFDIFFDIENGLLEFSYKDK